MEASFQILSENTQAQLRKLVSVQEEVVDAITRQRILKAISFENMSRRYEMVEDAHARTFEWIFGDGYPGEKEDCDDDDSSLGERGGDGDDDLETDANEFGMKRQASEKFLRWLSSEDGIFHVSGKLGSGKSTLMRFLYEHRGCKAELKKWAGKVELLFTLNLVRCGRY